MKKITKNEFEGIFFNNQFILWANSNFNQNRFLKTINIPEKRFCWQVHSSKVIESNPSQCIQADGHFSKLKSSLGIRTADCLPIFICHPKISIALHAGWKGLVNGIVLNGLKLIDDLQKESVHFFIGPHIQKNSFEIKSDTIGEFKKLSNSSFLESSFIHSSEGSYYIDLKKIAIHQATSNGIPEENIHCTNIDTFTNKQWYSYRRDKKTKGRNISFLVRTENATKIFEQINQHYN